MAFLVIVTCSLLTRSLAQGGLWLIQSYLNFKFVNYTLFESLRVKMNNKKELLVVKSRYYFKLINKIKKMRERIEIESKNLRRRMQGRMP